MGWGDEVLASGEAYAAYKATGRKVRILDYRRFVRPLHLAWENLEFIDQNIKLVDGRDCTDIINSGHARGYLLGYNDTHMLHNRAYRAKRGIITLSDKEIIFGRNATRGLEPFVVIESHNKATGSKAKATINKQWGIKKWQALVDEFRAAKITVVQLGPEGGKNLPGTHWVCTPTMRHASAVIARATACVLPEGGLHHTAAAFCKPSVVIFGGFTAPSMTGYEGHINLGTEDTCGSRFPCAHCRAEMEKISVKQVLDSFKLLGTKLC